MKYPLRNFVFIAVILYGIVRWWLDLPRSASVGPLLIPGQEPIQELLPRAISKLHSDREDIARIELTHRFEIIGEAISVARYRWAFTNPYFEVDLGLAWGQRVKEYKEKLTFRQTARWLMWSYRNELDEATRFDIQTHIGNLHLIPAEGRPEVLKAIRSLEKGDLVRVKGFLVRIFGPTGDLMATSSTSREDSGAGACEIVWVEEIQLNRKIYK